MSSLISNKVHYTTTVDHNPNLDELNNMGNAEIKNVGNKILKVKNGIWEDRLLI